MKTFKYYSIMLVMLVCCVGFASCSDDDDDDNSTSNEVKITNLTGSISFQSFRIVFLTANGETLINKDYGTVNNGESVSATIPTGATEYYMGTKINNIYFFSPNYPVSINNLKISYDEVAQWRSNS